MQESDLKRLVHELKVNDGAERSRFRILVFDQDDQRIGSLVPIDWGLAKDPLVVAKLTRWRARFRTCFLTQFVPTEARTCHWLETVVLPGADRILFLICTANDDAIGALGIRDLSCDQVELDHLIRGEKGGHPRLIHFASLALLRWLFEELAIPMARLRVFSHNHRPISFYKSLGFRLSAVFSLAREQHDGEVRYVIGEPCEGDEPSCLEMLLSADGFQAAHGQ